MHFLLKRQLQSLHIANKESTIDKKHFQDLLKLISYTYHENDTLLHHLQHNLVEQESQSTTSNIIKTVFEEATEGIIIEDAAHHIIHINPAMLNILKVEKATLLGKHTDYLSNMLPEKILTEITNTIKRCGHWHGEVEITRPDTKTIFAWLTIDTIYDNSAIATNLIIMVTDISELYHSRKRMKYLATHDSLTALPNRSLLFEHIHHAIDTAKRKNSIGALLFIDIDGFKHINDTYGHQTGDKLLQMFAQRLKENIRNNDIAGRLSGDEFLILLEEISTINIVSPFSKKLLDALSLPYLINNTSLKITVSIGISLFPKDGNDPTTLMHAADKAMYLVKKEGKNNFSFFEKV